MWLIRSLFALALLTLAQPCSAGLILTLTPTVRIDSETAVTITYTFSAAADVGTQAVGEYGFKAFPNQLPVWGNVQSFSVVTPPVNGSTWGVNEQFLSINSQIAQNIVIFETQSVRPAPAFKSIDTTGGVVGSFDITWNRPLVGQYDAAIGTALIQGSFAPEEFGTFSEATRAIGLGVSTIISAVPEPGSTILLAIASSGMLWRHQRRKWKAIGPR